MEQRVKVYGRLSRKLVLDSTATAKKIVSSKKRQREECSQLCDVLRQSGRLDCCKLEVAATANARPPTCCRLRAVSDEVAGRKLGERAAEFVVWRSLSSREFGDFSRFAEYLATYLLLVFSEITVLLARRGLSGNGSSETVFDVGDRNLAVGQ